MQQRVIFMGTPGFAVPALRVLADRLPQRDLLVVTQPDRAAGRGRKLQPPPVKAEAAKLKLELLQVETLRDPEIRAELEGFGPDLIVVAAFGRILPKWVLRLPSRGCVNLHASRLPRFRGASPVAAAIACGDELAGVSLMEMEAGLDTGSVFAEAATEIDKSETTETLTKRLAVAGAELLTANVDELLLGELAPVPQKGRVIETRKIVKAHGAIDWTASAIEIERHVRAMWPWPRAWTISSGDTRLQVHAASVIDDERGQPGTVIGRDDDGILVGTGSEAIRLQTVQLAGKAAQSAGQLGQHPSFAIGARFHCGEGFVEPEPWIVDLGEI